MYIHPKKSIKPRPIFEFGKKGIIGDENVYYEVVYDYDNKRHLNDNITCETVLKFLPVIGNTFRHKNQISNVIH